MDVFARRIPRVRPEGRPRLAGLPQGPRRFKTEVIHRRRPWRSFEAVEFATLEWVDWFNSPRLLEPSGNIPPVEVEDACHVQLEAMPIAAQDPAQMASGTAGAVQPDATASPSTASSPSP